MEKAFVQTLTSRGRHIGYGVYTEHVRQDGTKNGRCLQQYRFAGGQSLQNCDTAAIALHLANTHRDDFNAQIS